VQEDTARDCTVAETNGDTTDSRAPRRPAHDDHPLRRDDFQHIGRVEPTQLVALPDLELTDDVWIAVRDDTLDHPAPASGDREADGVRHPVARDGARGGEPLRLTRYDRHQRPRPRPGLMRNS